MTLRDYIENVKTICAEIYTEDMDAVEINKLHQRIRLAANMGAREMARFTYPLVKCETVMGPQDWECPAEMLRFVSYEGGKAERFVDSEGKEKIALKEKREYKITYHRAPAEVKNDEDVFEFPEDVMNALIYYGAYQILSSENDKRGFVYFKNLYDQECVNIIANRPSRLTVVKTKRGGMRAL